jgi:hypothetical protein
MNDDKNFKVLVLCKKKQKIISYPPKGCSLYTREQAIYVMKQLSPFDPWAESETERFDLSDII